MDDKMPAVQPPMMPMMGMMPQIIQNAFPSQMPDMEYDSGFISGFFQNRKAKQIEKYQKTRTIIDIHKKKSFMAQWDVIERFMMAPYKFKDFTQEMEHKEKMRQSECLAAEIAYQKAQLEARIMYYQVEQERIAFETAQKNFKQMFPEEVENE